MLHAVKTDAERYTYACEIMSIQKRLDVLNEDLRKMQQNKLPTKAALQYMTAEQYKHYTALVDSLRRYQKLKREAKTDAEREKYAAHCAKKESELEKLRI
jgi:mannitol-1-phosphate/altronate dehydrogenase